jgi:hypothetical protein
MLPATLLLYACVVYRIGSPTAFCSKGYWFRFEFSINGLLSSMELLVKKRTYSEAEGAFLGRLTAELFGFCILHR